MHPSRCPEVKVYPAAMIRSKILDQNATVGYRPFGDLPLQFKLVLKWATRDQ